MKLPELLAPAGSRDAFVGAVNAGADAVYLAGSRFGARAYAENFGDEELLETLDEAHLLGKKVYLTANVLTKQDELSELADFIRPLYEHGLDGVIVQDFGVLRMLGRQFPELALHASTQMSVTTAQGVRHLKEQGVVRVVPARELSLEEIRRLKEEDIEIEAFIHGAMCYSYSGRCLMSSFLGGRSGNRGRCAGTCRLPYAVLDQEKHPVTQSCWPVSMKDMCVLPILPQLIDAGIDSFKIEGRMKKPAYAAGVTAIYRKYMDKYVAWDAGGRKKDWEIEEEDLRQLQHLYIRTDLSTGYYHTKNDRRMITITSPGYAGTPDELIREITDRYLTGMQKVPVRGEAVIRCGSRAELQLSAHGRQGTLVTAKMYGQEAGEATGRPMTEEELSARLSKTGATPFAFEQLTVSTDNASFLPVSAVNALRRDGLELLKEKLLAQYRRSSTDTACGSADAKARRKQNCKAAEGGNRTPLKIVLVRSAEQLQAAATRSDVIVLDGDMADMFASGRLQIPSGKPVYIALPHVLRQADMMWLENLYASCCAKAEGFYVRSQEELEFLKEKVYYGKVIADTSLYCWNSESRDLLLEHCDYVVLPAELSGRELLHTFSDDLTWAVTQVYGYLPLMITANCIKKTTHNCGSEGIWYLKDRTDTEFPVMSVCSRCYNIVYNSVPLSLHRYLADPLIRESAANLFVFTIENARETAQVLDGFSRGDFRPADHTAGHFRKGAQ